MKKIERNSLEKLFDDNDNVEALGVCRFSFDASFLFCFCFDKFVELEFLFGKM